MRLRTLQEIILYRYRLVVGYGLITLAALSFGWWRLTSVAHGFSTDELATIGNNLNWHTWLQQPLSPITHTLQWAVIKIWGLSLFGLRSVSVFMGIAALIYICLSIRYWLGRTTAILIGILVISSSWWLLLTRQATGSSELLFWLAMACYFIWKLHKTSDKRWWYGWCLSLVGLSYSPGGLWILLVIVAMTVFDNNFRQSLQQIRLKHKVIGIAIYILGTAPIIYLGVKNSQVMLSFLNIQNGLTLTQYLHNTLNSIASIFAQLPNISATNGITGRYVFRFMQSALVILGLFAVIRGYKYKNTPLSTSFRLAVIILLICGALISGLSQNYIGNSYLIFPVILAMSAGLWLLMQTWNSVFPLNPYPRTFGFIVIMLLMAFTVLGNYKIYFNTWAVHPATSYAFSPQLVDQQRVLKKLPSGDCNVVYMSSEQALAQFEPYLLGYVNRKEACEPRVVSSADPNSQVPQIISAESWQNIDYYHQNRLLANHNYPVTNARSMQSLDYWVVLP